MTPPRDGARRVDARGLRLVGEGRLQCLHRTARYEERDGTRDREIVSLKSPLTGQRKLWLGNGDGRAAV